MIKKSNHRGKLSKWSKVSLAVASASIAGATIAQVAFPSRGIEQETDSPQMQLPLSTPKASIGNSINLMSPLGTSALSDTGAFVASNAKVSHKAPALKADADFTGKWVMTYKSMIVGGADSGSAVTITTGSNPTEFTVNDFYNPGLSIHGTIDPATATITIPNQIFAENASGVKLDITAINPSNGNADRKTPITGHVNTDGTIAIDTPWGIYDSTKSVFPDGVVAVYNNTRLVRPNGTFSFTQGGQTEEVDIYAEQKSGNVLEVTNLLNAGLTIEMVLSRDKTASIALQPILATQSITYNIVNATIEGEKVSFTTPVTTAAATDPKVITWTNWSGYGLDAQDKPGWLGMFTMGKISLEKAVEYPVMSTTKLDGEGTKENPWLIKNLDDLLFFSEMVNASSGNSNELLYSGKYFSMTADIDMQQYRFTPIAKDFYHVFDGTFNGNGHTIKGLTVNTTSGYGGLFGNVGPNSLITDFTIDGASISAQSISSCVAAWSRGEISKVNVLNSEVTNLSGATAAISGNATVITDCHSDNCRINGYGGYVGGVAGQLNGTMTRCSATNLTLRGSSSSKSVVQPVGGLAGLSNFKSSITDSYCTGTVDATVNSTECMVGGLVGDAFGSSMERCFFSGIVSGYLGNSMTGGLAGSATSVSFSDCYVNGDVINASSRKTGGLVGYVTNGKIDDSVIPDTFKNCYSAANVFTTTYLYNPDKDCREVFGLFEDNAVYTAENIYFNNQISDFGSTKYGVSGAYLTSAEGPKGFSKDVWTITEGEYPRLNSSASTEAALFSASALLMKENNSLGKLSEDATIKALGATAFKYLKNGQLSDEGYYSKIEGDKIVVNNEFLIGTDTLYVTNGKAQYFCFLKVAPVPFEGLGTEQNPYLIKTKEDLIALSKITSENKQVFPGTYFRMTNDIDLGYSEDYLGICGDGASDFMGIFDGDGHAVHKMRIHVLEWKTPPTETSLGTAVTTGQKLYQGFVGRLGVNGIVKNVTIASDCDIVVSGYSGAVVGYSYGRIENCVNNADVLSYSGIYIGGITGYVNPTDNSVVEGCLNTGDITTARFGAGGISGVNYGLIKNCANTGDVAAKVLVTNYDAGKNYLVGGITGSFVGKIENSINYGTVTGNDRVGGISGTIENNTGNFIYHNSVMNTINVGMVYSASPTTTGAFGGLNGSTDVISNNYYDSQLLPIPAAGNASMKGIEGVETSVLTSGTLLEGYDADLWDFSKGLYPSLKAFAQNDVVKEARSIIVDIPAGKTAYELQAATATLSEAEGLKWSLASAKDFSIKGSTLAGPASVTTTVADTLYADFSNLRKPILIKALPPIPLNGEGTEASPYMITTPGEWNALALYISQTANTLEEKYVALGNDIDFTGKDFTPMAFDGANYFNGTFDGKGFTVKGIKYATTAAGQGAFGTIGSTATVKNLTISGEITSAFVTTGGFAGSVYGSLADCVNEVKVTSTKATAGGIAATVLGNASLTGCVNKADISAASSVGGIVGIFDKNSKVTLTECANSGTITGNSSSAYVAGIAGQAYPATFISCSNSGTVTVKTPTSQSHAAGIIGFANGFATAPAYKIEKCVNSGNITAKSNCAGIVSNVPSSAGYTTLHISECENTGKISAKGTGNTSNTANAGIVTLLTPGSKVTDCVNRGEIEVGVNQYTAGVAGYARVAATADKPIIISGCENHGKVSGKSYNVGGVVANAAAYVTVENCFNTGEVAGLGTGSNGYAVGGVIGSVTNANARVKACWNSGKVSAVNRVGGIVGMNAQKASVSDCFNTGDILSTSETQGTAAAAGHSIGGIAGQGASVFERCANFGTVKGASRVGGLIGNASKNNTSLIDSYNAGKIEAPADTCGNLIGNNLRSGALWSASNAITDSYYVKEFGTYENNAGLGTAVTFGDLAKTDLGADWQTAGEYCLPILKIFSTNETALLYSAAVVVKADDTFENVTTDFNVGVPAGVKWTSSAAALQIDGDNARFTEAYTGEITLTATNLEGASRTVVIKANAKGSGIGDIDTDDSKAEYYTLDGLRVAEPVEGEVYVVRKGTKTSKMIYRK